MHCRGIRFDTFTDYNLIFKTFPCQKIPMYFASYKFYIFSMILVRLSINNVLQSKPAEQTTELGTHRNLSWQTQSNPVHLPKAHSAGPTSSHVPACPTGSSCSLPLPNTCWHSPGSPLHRSVGATMPREHRRAPEKLLLLSLCDTNSCQQFCAREIFHILKMWPQRLK